MELRHLRFFTAVAEHLNFSRAAEALHASQPSLSQQIRKLERELGGAQFERTKRYVALTVFCDSSFSQVVYRPLTPRTPLESMMVACRRDRQFAPVVRSFIEHVESLKLVFAPPV